MNVKLESVVLKKKRRWFLLIKQLGWDILSVLLCLLIPKSACRSIISQLDHTALTLDYWTVMVQYFDDKRGLMRIFSFSSNSKLQK